MLGPYYIKGSNLAYRGNKVFRPLVEVRKVKPPDLSKRHIEIRKEVQKWAAIIKIWDEIFRATTEFMKKKRVLFFDLPITTRMISSPGALTGTIPSDVNPFEIKFFDKTTYLTQSSQLYLEFAITNPEINSVYCWEKSFRREKADFRHLPEFTHIEFESNIDFEENLKFQQNYVQFLVNSLIENCKKEILVFLTEKEIKELDKFSNLKTFERITFHDAFKLLRKKTENPKYDKVTIKNFSAYEEVLLTEIINKPVFVTHYIGDEVAFYHAIDPQNPKLVINADFLFPGYGEIIGSGERVHTHEETKEKAKHFKLNMKDYQPYIESRDPKNPKVHSGWGMGVERFVQAILKLPFIWETKPFPRVDGQIRP
jgi:aspartyl/asparaginyl-tRNA synthetase